MIPLISSAVDNFQFSGECSCSKCSTDEDEESVCPVCSVKFEIRVKNVEDKYLTVTSNDLIPVKARSEHQQSVRPVHFDIELNDEIKRRFIPIVKLGKNQELWAECIAKKGIGQDHTKWSPVCVCSLRYDPIITLNEDRDLELNESKKREIVNSCPKKVFELDVNTQRLLSRRPQDCIYCFECLKKTQEFDVVDFIKIEEGDYIFEIETNGSLKPDEIVDSAFQQMAKKLETVKNNLEQVKIK